MAVAPENRMAVLRWLAHQSVVLHAAILIALGTVLCAFILAPRWIKIQSIRREVNELKQFMNSAQNTLERIHDIDRLLRQRREELDKLNNQTISEDEEAKMIATFTQAVSELPVTIIKIDPEDDREYNERDGLEKYPWLGEGFKKKHLNVEMQCRYRTLGELLEKIEASELTFTVDQLRVARAEGIVTPALSISLKLAAFAEQGR